MNWPKVMVYLHPVASAAALYYWFVSERGHDGLKGTNSKHLMTRSRQTFNSVPVGARMNHLIFA